MNNSTKLESIKNDVIAKYKELHNIWKVGVFFGVSGQSVHAKLTQWNEIVKMNYFTKEDEYFLLLNYGKYRDDGKLPILASIMNRTTAFLSRKAKSLGLTIQGSHPFYGDKKKCSESAKIRLARDGHTRGMLGKKHNDESKLKFSIHTKQMWADSNSKFNSEEFKQKQSDRMMMYQTTKNNRINNYSRTTKGWWEKGDRKYYMRSSWEPKYAEYLCLLERAKEIINWEYEPDVFYFEAIKRGTRSYTPDFKIFNNDGTIEYHEVKGWMDDKSKTKIKRMAKYYPEINLVIIDQNKMKNLRLL